MDDTGRSTDILIIGAGQAGLAVAYYLRRAARRDGPAAPSFVLLDAQSRPGGAWRHYWDSLELFSPADTTVLPGMRMPAHHGPGNPRGRDVVTYLTTYEQRYDLPVRRSTPVTALRAEADGTWTARTPRGDWHARVVVSATGTWTRPAWPSAPVIPGQEDFRGAVTHTVHYRSPAQFAGQHVVVVGGGNSGAQIAAELFLDAHVRVTWATHRPPAFMPDDVDGRVLFDAGARRALAAVRRQSPDDAARPRTAGDITGDIVVTPPVAAARSAGLRAVPLDSGRLLDDADVLLLCTGFHPELGHLRSPEARLPDGFTLDPHPRTTAAEPTRSAEAEGLYFVGYGDWTGPASATVTGATRTARPAAADILARWASDRP
ncbi:NAD(P)-binding domain-containing protein [Corynebacterium bovis]|uniref:NAD(P)-binding domain-containing protein n=1 Tax=Corynebacterium bovis TaxID=36808 RepID=UPI000F64B04C|nr:NAD(P)-binding domain-containing protein [Corynebacterium bovis]RRO80546.1 hypothetical protein CXF38_06265 [Corynebacterium bovis]RRO83806.1 hypothetical protein CXF36_01925 [Corynebacterium bovis]RRO84958.1 hypothetical protein CXF37_01405 [Corynebacterium bovis]RRO92404.1 hypothetical protein CXF45_01455 [Corynebacterium bovis]RRO96808.1 hypothetical protein CXF29_00925 [Corynebacterium bovis]